MKKSIITTAITLSLLSFSTLAADMVTTSDQFFAKNGVTVTEDNYATIESSRQFIKNQDLAGINKLLHKRQLTPTDNQPVVRMNRDTYYSLAVVDVSKGAYITMPKLPEGKYMSIQGVTEDHRIQAMQYGSGKFHLTTHTGTHLYLVIRLDSTFTEAEAKKYQDKMQITAKSNNKFKAEQTNKESFEKVENSLKMQISGILKQDGAEALYGMFTDTADASKELFTKKKYAVGAAIGWGGAQIIDNVYEVSGNYPMDKCHQATFADPENEAFWSITVYNKAGFMFNDVAHINSNTATMNKDGTYTVSLGCGDNAINNIKTKNASGVFNLGIRHYMPTEKVKSEGYRILPLVKAI